MHGLGFCLSVWFVDLWDGIALSLLAPQVLGKLQKEGGRLLSSRRVEALDIVLLVWPRPAREPLEKFTHLRPGESGMKTKRAHHVSLEYRC